MHSKAIEDVRLDGSIISSVFRTNADIYEKLT